MSTYVYGWRKDSPDRRDSKFCTILKAVPVVAQPPVVSLRAKMPPVYNQGELGSCTANALAGALEYDGIILNGTAVMPSRLFIYYNERAVEGTVFEDSGAQIRDGVKVVNRFGACPETVWPYNISRFTVRPPKNAYIDAERFAALTYHSVAQTTDEIKTALAMGRPVVFGFSVYSNFESPEMAAHPFLNPPTSGEQFLGGHAVVCVGYDTTREPGKTWFEVRNSWGAEWGDGGYFWMSEDYITDARLANDFWVLDSVGALPNAPLSTKPKAWWQSFLHWLGL